MNIEEIHKIVGLIKTNLFKNSNSISIGMLKSHFKGSGLMFKEHRIYSHGDDVRFIDWKLLAKSQTPYVKTFEEERNIEISIVLDATPTMLMGYKRTSKLKAAIDIICLLYLLAKETHDYIHVFLLKETIINLPKASGEEGVIRFVDALTKNGIIDPHGNVNYDIENFKKLSSDTIYLYLSKYIKRNSEIVFLSDFMDLFDDYHLQRVLKDKRTHCFRLLSPVEELSKGSFRILANSPQGKYLWKAHSKTRKEKQDSYHKKMKFINVKGRYLEVFVKEMQKS